MIYMNKRIGNARRGTRGRIKRILFSGAAFPAPALAVIISSPWSENYRSLRLMHCYLPMPLLLAVYLTALFFLSVSFFFDSECSSYRNAVSLYNARLLTLSGAFFLVIWFCMGICVISPLVSLLCAAAALASAFFACCSYARWGRLSFLLTLLASILISSIVIMNVRVLFI